jgi:hypothetical protein
LSQSLNYELPLLSVRTTEELNSIFMKNLIHNSSFDPFFFSLILRPPILKRMDYYARQRIFAIAEKIIENRCPFRQDKKTSRFRSPLMPIFRLRFKRPSYNDSLLPLNNSVFSKFLPKSNRLLSSSPTGPNAFNF